MMKSMNMMNVQERMLERYIYSQINSFFNSLNSTHLFSFSRF